MPPTPRQRVKSPRPEGQASKRTPEQVLAHRAQVARWLREEPRLRVEQMALRLGVSLDTAASDRRWCLEEWRKTREMDTAAHADAAYAQFNAWLEEAWRAWHDSRREQEEVSATEEEDVVQERVERHIIGGPMDGTTTSEVVPVRTRKRSRHSVKRTASPGDPRFIAMGLKATEGIIDLLGLAGRGAAQQPPSTDLAELAQSNPQFMAEFLAALDRAGLLDREALAAGEEDDDEEEEDLDASEAPSEVGRHPMPR